MFLGDRLHQFIVAYGIAKAAHHGGNLSVEDRGRNSVAEKIEDLDVLTRGVKYLECV